jgi:NhaA family Na+:H+ antiporter
MAIFFFVVGLEIRREVHAGELSDLRRAALPIAAALGGMLVPAAIYAILNHGGPGQAGWGVPMATDIAFAVGVLTLLGRRVPPALRVLLLALAVIDDLGAIIVIAIFYSDGLAPAWLGVSAPAAGWASSRWALGVRGPAAWAYAAPAVVACGGHVRRRRPPDHRRRARGAHDAGARRGSGPEGYCQPLSGQLSANSTRPAWRPTNTRISSSVRDAGRDGMSRGRVPGRSSLHRIGCTPWVAFGIMPIFALANAGVSLEGMSLGGRLGERRYAASRRGLGARQAAVGVPGRVLGERWHRGWRACPSRRRRARPARAGAWSPASASRCRCSSRSSRSPPALLGAAKLAILIASGLAMVLGGVLGVALLPRPAGPDDDVVDEQVAERSLDE